MYLYTPRHLGLAISLLQQPRRFHPPLLQCVKISANSRWIAHARQDSTIFQKCQYIIQYSIDNMFVAQQASRASNFKNYLG